MIQLIPAIDLIDGRCVRLCQGDFGKVSSYDSHDPVETALRYEACGIKRLHLVDLDGARFSEPRNLRTLEAVASKVSCEIEWGGGLSGPQALESALSAGATQLIIGSKAALEPRTFASWLEKYGPQHIILGADIKNGEIAVKGWKESAPLSINALLSLFPSLQEAIVTDISRDGMLEGPSFGLYESLMKAFPSVSFTASGGVSGIADIERLDDAGVPKAIVGKALYEGRISLKDLERWSQNA